MWASVRMGLAVAGWVTLVLSVSAFTALDTCARGGYWLTVVSPETAPMDVMVARAEGLAAYQQRNATLHRAGVAAGVSAAALLIAAYGPTVLLLARRGQTRRVWRAVGAAALVGAAIVLLFPPWHTSRLSVSRVAFSSVIAPPTRSPGPHLAVLLVELLAVALTAGGLGAALTWLWAGSEGLATEGDADRSEGDP